MARLGDGGELLKCSFCGKSQRQVKKLIAGPGVYICDECIQLCSEIIEEEKEQDAEVLVAEKSIADYFDACVELHGDSKICANWVNGEVSRKLNEENIAITGAPVTPELLVSILKRIADNTISGKIAKQVFEAMWDGEGDADVVIEAKGLKQITDSGAIEAMVDEVIANNPDQFEQLKGGKDKLMGFFVGQVMKASKGKANPGMVNQLMQKKLKG